MLYYSLKKEPSLLNNMLVRNRRIVQTFYAVRVHVMLGYVPFSNV